MNKISQRQAARWRIEAKRLKAEITALKRDIWLIQDLSTWERVALTRWGPMGQRLLDEINTARRLGFRVEVIVDGDHMTTYALRRRS